METMASRLCGGASRSKVKVGTRITAPDVEGDRLGTVRFINGGTVYVHWDGDGKDVVGSAPLAGVVIA